MMKKLIAVLVAMSLLFAVGAYAEDNAAAESEFELTTEYRWFVNEYNNVRGYTVTYYDDVYAYNHGEHYLTPFSSVVSAEYFVMDESGTLAVAPIVLDITDAMRERLYGADVGETYLLYGQYCERVVGKKGREGFSGVHEGIDFVNFEACPLYAILGGEVTRAGDSNGTVGVYNADLDITLLYLHCEDIEVRRGDVIEAGDLIALEGDKKAGSYYTHVEMRHGRHTSSSPYRGPKLTSDCPYAVLQEALGVTASGRQPVTAAAVYEAQRMREEAEAALRAQEEEAAKLAEEAAKAAEPQIELVDTLPGVEAGYGFEGAEEAAETAEEAAEPTAVPEATLPPSA